MHRLVVTTVCSLTTTTVTTSSSNSSPVVSASADARASLASLDLRERRRSSSESLAKHQAGTREEEQDRLFRTRQLVASRSRTFTQNLDAILERARDRDGSTAHWLPDELRSCQCNLDRLEDVESTAWTLVGRLEGKSAQKRRMEKWREWYNRETERLRQAKSLSWDSRPRDAATPREDHYKTCRRSAGHVEKVKLPTFSGRQEDFSEFKSQFRELCAGERYTPILEMAQLKIKLPREALNAISGIAVPGRSVVSTRGTVWQS